MADKHRLLALAMRERSTLIRMIARLVGNRAEDIFNNGCERLLRAAVSPPKDEPAMYVYIRTTMMNCAIDSLRSKSQSHFEWHPELEALAIGDTGPLHVYAI
jgi:DNA-directed RNA polymerase specialized sigma24 family protein